MTLRPLWVLYLFTLVEFTQRKAFQILFLFLLIFFISIPAWKHFAPETRIDFLQDLGIGILGIYMFLASLIVGTDIIPQDIEHRRFLFFITHPMSRLEYLLARWGGAATMLVITAVAFLLLLKGFFFWRGTPVAISPALILILKYLVFLAFLFFIAPAVERFSAVFLGAAFFFFANSLETMNFLAAESERPGLQFWVRVLDAVMPHFELFAPRGAVSPGDPLFLAFAGRVILYAGGFIVFYLALAWSVLRRKGL